MKWFFIIAGIIAIGAWLVVDFLPLIVATTGGASIVVGILDTSIEF